MQRPVLVAVPQREAEDEAEMKALEAEALRELCGVAGKWLHTLPASSSWRAIFERVHQACLTALRHRSRQLQQSRDRQAS